jgi:uncharacterized protein YlxW (UPF0749 family)
MKVEELKSQEEVVKITQVQGEGLELTITETSPGLKTIPNFARDS